VAEVPHGGSKYLLMQQITVGSDFTSTFYNLRFAAMCLRATASTSVSATRRSPCPVERYRHPAERGAPERKRVCESHRQVQDQHSGEHH